MEYCDLHKDLSDEDGEGCPLCEKMIEHDKALTRWAETYRTQKEEITTLKALVRKGAKLHFDGALPNSFAVQDYLKEVKAICDKEMIPPTANQKIAELEATVIALKARLAVTNSPVWRNTEQRPETDYTHSTPATEPAYTPKTEMGRKMMDLREKAVVKGMTLLDEDEIAGGHLHYPNCEYPVDLPEGMVLVKKEYLPYYLHFSQTTIRLGGYSTKEIEAINHLRIAIGGDKALEEINEETSHD